MLSFILPFIFKSTDFEIPHKPGNQKTPQNPCGFTRIRLKYIMNSTSQSKKKIKDIYALPSPKVDWEKNV